MCHNKISFCYNPILNQGRQSFIYIYSEADSDISIRGVRFFLKKNQKIQSSISKRKLQNMVKSVLILTPSKVKLEDLQVFMTYC